MSKDDDFGIKDIIKLIEDATSYIDDNRDMIESITGSGRIRLRDEDPLVEATKTEEKVIITMEVSGESFSNISLMYNDGVLKVDFNGDVVTADVPGDIMMEDADASLNNGVLNIEIPRGAS